MLFFLVRRPIDAVGRQIPEPAVTSIGDLSFLILSPIDSVDRHFLLAAVTSIGTLFLI